MNKGIKSKEFSYPLKCKKFNNFVSKVFALVFRSDRVASIEMIKKVGMKDMSGTVLIIS